MKTKYSNIAAVLAVLFLTCSPAAAQFSSEGADPGSIRWEHIDTDHYSVIYPSGQEALARCYATALERVWKPVGNSIGYLPNQFYRKPMPVVLHTRTSWNNGMVTWAPHRMEMLTVPSAYNPLPALNPEHLALHESRHVSQMQLGRDPVFRGWNWIIGEFAPSAIVSIYTDPAFREGDAVLAETALSNTGRGRTADFLEYYRACFARGERRDYWQWRYGSLTRYTPDYYKLGYVTMAGMRSVFDTPDFTASYYRRLKRHGGVAFWNFQKTVREASGKAFLPAFDEVCNDLAGKWEADAVLRGPFMPSAKLTADRKYHTEYRGTVSAFGKLYSIRSGIAEAPTLVSIDSTGSEKRERAFSGTTSRLQYSFITDRIYWSENRRDVRWELAGSSVIRFMDRAGNIRDLHTGGRLYNPACSPDEAYVSATEYLEDGSTGLVVLDAYSGRRLWAYGTPGFRNWQLVESAWLNDQIYVSAITDEGFGIYSVHDYSVVLPPQSVKIKQLGTHDGRLTFVSDRDGTDELYALDPSSGELTRLTNAEIGVGEYAFDRGRLYYSMPEPEGRMIYSTDTTSLRGRPVDWNLVHNYPWAGVPGRGTAADGTYGRGELAEGEPETIGTDGQVKMSEPEPYGKLAHLFRFHSWLPASLAYNSVGSLSLESVTTSLGIGATAFFQNTLGTSSGYVGTKLFDDHLDFQPSLHAGFIYTGLYPVIEAEVNFNDRMSRNTMYTAGEKGYDVAALLTDKPYLSGSLSAYIPFNFSSGGWLRGLVPKLKVSGSDDRYSLEDNGTVTSLSGRVSLSLRGYTMMSTPASKLYPKFGIGFEAGLNRPFGSMFAGSAYALIYGYLPGIAPLHSIKLTALGQTIFKDGGILVDSYSIITPRGFNSNVAAAVSGSPVQARFTFDYHLPFASLDWGGLSPLAYLRNFELTPHADLTMLRNGKFGGDGFLSSVGADLSAVLGNLLWIPYDTRIGVSYNWNSGSLYSALEQNGVMVSRHSVSLIFSISM